MTRSAWAAALLYLLLSAGAAGAQADCTYERCALRIAPRWNGLATVRGSGEETASLEFLFPHRISAAFAGGRGSVAGADSAVMYAERAFTTRRTAAFFTGLGIVAISAAAVRAAVRGEFRREDAIVASAGAASFAVSVPLQFSADDLLGRAVWWYNRRFAAR